MYASGALDLTETIYRLCGIAVVTSLSLTLAIDSVTFQPHNRWATLVMTSKMWGDTT